jgi:segregation and condensation protein B
MTQMTEEIIDEAVSVLTEPAPGELSVNQLEALLFVAERPLARREIASLAGIERDQVDALLGDLEVTLRERGLRLLSAGEHVQLVTSPEAGRLIARYVGADGGRLSPAALETLAIVAYRQPVTRAVIERIRGVDSDYVLRSLLHRRLVVEQGRAESVGRPFLYGTGFDFLERFGLTSLDELPPLEPEAALRLDE